MFYNHRIARAQRPPRAVAPSPSCQAPGAPHRASPPSRKRCAKRPPEPLSGAGWQLPPLRERRLVARGGWRVCVGVGAKARLAELWDEHLAPVVQHGVEALQHALARQVELVQQHPAALLQRLQQRACRGRKGGRTGKRGVRRWGRGGGGQPAAGAQAEAALGRQREAGAARAGAGCRGAARDQEPSDKCLVIVAHEDAPADEWATGHSDSSSMS